MRSVAMIALLAGMLPVHAAAQVLTASFSGTLPSAFLTDVHAGDTFSGSATWNASSLTTVALQSASLTMPVGDGLNFASIPNAKVVGAAAVYTAGVFSYIQINVKSTVDNTVYLVIAAPSTGGLTNVSFSATDVATGYSFTGPSVVVPATPVPPTLLLTIAALGCLGLYQAKRRFAQRT